MARVFQGGPEPKGWHALRFTAAPNKVRVDCAECGKPMWLPPSKVSMYQRCGPACQNSFAGRAKAARTRPCETCGKMFTPRSTQVAAAGGRFCSQGCNSAGHAALQVPETMAKAADGFREAMRDGRVRVLRGEDSPCWRGGWQLRAKMPARQAAKAARTRAYRAENPDKVREWRRDRRVRKGGQRLPRGTVKAIGAAQRWRCAVCAVSVRKAYHLDHIQPLGRDGEHVPRNLQLLCPTCNLQKNDKDPIDFMREKGLLL